MSWPKGVARKTVGDRLPDELRNRELWRWQQLMRSGTLAATIPAGMRTLPVLPSLREPLYVVQTLQVVE
jgi:hypothetical protein